MCYKFCLAMDQHSVCCGAASCVSFSFSFLCFRFCTRAFLLLLQVATAAKAQDQGGSGAPAVRLLVGVPTRFHHDPPVHRACSRSDGRGEIELFLFLYSGSRG